MNKLVVIVKNGEVSAVLGNQHVNRVCVVNYDKPKNLVKETEYIRTQQFTEMFSEKHIQAELQYLLTPYNEEQKKRR